MNHDFDTEQQSVSSKSWLNFLVMELLFVFLWWWCKSYQRTQKALLKVSWRGFCMERKTRPVTENAKARLKEEKRHLSLSWRKPKCTRCIFSFLGFARDNSEHTATPSLGAKATVAKMKISRTSVVLWWQDLSSATLRFQHCQEQAEEEVKISDHFANRKSWLLSTDSIKITLEGRVL